MKTKVFNFVRGLRNGTPPRFQSYLKSLILLGFLTIGISQAQAKEGDILTTCVGTGSGYGTRRTATYNDIGWVLSTGQSGYLGTNNATNHGKVKPTADDLPVVKAVKSDATTSTTGYYFYYTTTSLTNVNKIVFSYTGNSGLNGGKAYVVMGDKKSASGGAAYTQVPLATTSTSQQGVGLGTGGTFTFTFAETLTSAQYYGLIIEAGSTKRLTSGSIAIYEGAAAPAVVRTVAWKVNNETYTVGSPTTQVNDGSKVTTLPTAPTTDCGGKVFVGWTATENYTDPTTAPSDLFNTAAGAPIVSGNVTYHAVFADNGTSGEKAYTLTINKDNINVNGYSDTEEEKTYYAVPNDGIGDNYEVICKVRNVCINGSNIQLKKYYGTEHAIVAYVYNTTSLNKISSVVTSNSLEVKYGASQHPTGSGTNQPYFTVQNNSSGAVTAESIVVSFAVGATTYSNYSTTCAPPSQCQTPVISLAGGTYTEAKTTTITCGTDGATIYYTTNGNTPSASSTPYTGAITVNQDMTIKAIAIKAGLENSEIATASYTINYTVTFDMMGHGSAIAALTSVKYNASINSNKPADPSVTGYTFGDWYKENTCTNAWNWTTDKVTGNITLYAKWTAKTTEVTLSAPNADIEQGTTQVTATYDKAMPTTSVTMPQRTGYTFNGYFAAETGGTKYYNASGTSAKNWDKEDATFTLHAQWTAKTYTITYKNQGNTTFTGTHETGYPTNHTYDQTTTLKTATRNGYIFGGWYENQDCSGSPVTEIGGQAKTNNFTLYAKWTARTTTVSFDKNTTDDVQNMPAGTITNTFDAALITTGVTIPSRVGYDFVGWFDSSNKKYYGVTDNTITTSVSMWDKAEENIILLAHWTPQVYNISYKDQGGGAFSGSWGTHPTQHTYGTLTNLVNPTKAHFDFVGWYINSDCLGEPLTSLAADEYLAPITLYAKWNEHDKYTVTFVDDVQGTDCSAWDMKNEYVNTQIVFHSIGDKTRKAPDGDCVTDHYHFVGWIEEGVDPQTNPVISAGTTSIKITKNVTYKAVWAKEL